MTPRLLAAIGMVGVRWVHLDKEVTHMSNPFWAEHHPTQRMPRPFDKRADFLNDCAKSLYTNDQNEYRIFGWYLHRLRAANSARDNICHGIPGIVARYKPQTVEDIESLADQLDRFMIESMRVTQALWAARSALLQGMSARPSLDASTPPKPDHHSPKLPRENRPPSTFRV